MPLPSAEYARSKLPTKADIEAEEMRKQEALDAYLEKQKEEARKEIESVYKEGMSAFNVEFVYVPNSVMQEMFALGWKVEQRMHPFHNKWITTFSLPID